MKKILFNGLGNRGWIGGLYYLKNIIFSCLQNPEITKKYQIVVLIDPEHAGIFDCFRISESGGKETAGSTMTDAFGAAGMRAGRAAQVDIRVYDSAGKWKLALYEMKLIWFGGVKYCYALELNKIGKLFRKKGIFWIPDFQHRTLPEFFKPEELERKIANDTNMVMCENPMVLSSFDAKNDLEKFYPEHKCPVEVVHFVSYIEPEIRAITPKMEQQVSEKFGLKKNYIYLPNQFWQHKNHIVAVQAVELIKKQGKLQEYDFVFTGNLEDYRNPGYIDRLKKIMEAPEAADSIKLLGFVDRTEQLSIMKNAAFIVQPSLCEGWGTVLEDAKVLDKAVLLSDIAVHREQKNEKCTLFDPHDAAGLAELIINTAEDAKKAERAAFYAGDMEQGISNMYREAAEYSKGLERIFR